MSCGTVNQLTPKSDYSFVYFDIPNEDYTSSAKPAIEKIKENFKTGNDSLRVIIVSAHNGRFIKDISIVKTYQEIVVISSTSKSFGSMKKQEKKFKLNEFYDLLDTLIAEADNQLVIAGTYQKIYIETPDSRRIEYRTRKAMGLINEL